MRKILWRLPILVLLCAAVIVGVEIWGGVSRSATSILRHAERVEVFRVSPVYAKDQREGTINGYLILDQGKEQGPEFAARLSSVLRGWSVANRSKKCVFNPGLAFRIWSGDRAVEVLVCFLCDDLWPHVVGEAGTMHGEILAFDPVRADLVALAKEAFPDDLEIQGLTVGRPTEEEHELMSKK